MNSISSEMKIQIINIIITSTKINISFVNNFGIIIMNFRVKKIYFEFRKGNRKKKKPNLTYPNCP
jgi:hypothetical protein